MILGDVIMEGNKPPEKMTVVDPAKVLNSRSEVQREWVKRAALFKSVWDNGKVYMWRPVVPIVPARYLQRKHLHPLGWIFTTSPAPPDIENVCVIHEEYLQQMTEDDLDILPSWSTDGYFFEAKKFTDRTLVEIVEPEVRLEVTGEDLGLTLRGVDFQGTRRMVVCDIQRHSEAAECAGLEEGMLLSAIMGIKAVTIQETAIKRLEHKRPLRLVFEKERSSEPQKSIMDLDGDGELTLSDAAAAAGAIFKGGARIFGKVGGMAGGLAAKGAKGALSKSQPLTHLHHVGSEDNHCGVKVQQQASVSKSRDANAPCEAMFFLERKNKLLYASLDNSMYCDITRMESFWCIKKDIQPEEESDTIARSSRYTPHLNTLRLANQADGEDFVCSAMMTQLHSSRQGLEMMTGSGSSFRAWDISKGECVRELNFPGAKLTCLAAAGNR